MALSKVPEVDQFWEIQSDYFDIYFRYMSGNIYSDLHMKQNESGETELEINTITFNRVEPDHYYNKGQMVMKKVYHAIKQYCKNIPDESDVVVESIKR